MKREIIVTNDGSTTIHLPEWNEQYHSKHGAVQEAYHVFIKNGLSLFFDTTVTILEMGFGTGLNSFITFLEAQKYRLTIDYVGVEAYPVSLDEILKMNYIETLKASRYTSVFEKMHAQEWDTKHTISTYFSLLKRKQFFQQITDQDKFNLIYFDAFGARVQPELWTEELFKKMFVSLKKGGVLVTYSAKGSVRRALQHVGFRVERLPGPPGKREMLRAVKI